MTTPADYCPGCFADKGRANPCPHCSYNEQVARGSLLLPHRTLLHDQFLVGRVLGKPGGFGITYLGWDLGLHRLIAIKEYLPRELASRGADRATIAPHSRNEGDLFRYGVGQFLEEARTLARLDHPNIVRVYHVFEANGTAYLVMEYYAGLTLAEHLDRHGGRLPEAAALQLLRPVLDGLRAVHAKGFLHRDIKPQNIYLAHTDSGGVRPILLDFGTARQAVGERSQSISVVITPGYAPFEQYHRRGHQGPWTDIYATAAVLYRMVTGLVPPEANERVAGDDLKPASAYGASQALSDTLAGALSLATETRPQTVQAFQDQLWPKIQPPPPLLPDTPTPPPPVQPPPPKATSIGPWVALVLGTVAIAGFWYLISRDRTEQFTAERRRHDDTAFSAARREDTASAYRSYLAACGGVGCGHELEAEQGLARLSPVALPVAPPVVPPDRTPDRAPDRTGQDDDAYATVRGANTTAAYRAYLATCADNGCGHRTEAQQRLAQIGDAERDDAAFDTARTRDIEAAYRSYLDSCGSTGCTHQSEASSRLDALTQRGGQAVARVRAYFDYVNTGQVDEAIACLMTPGSKTRVVIANTATAQVNDARLISSDDTQATVWVDYTGATRDGKRQRWQGLIPMRWDGVVWRIETLKNLARQ